MDGTLTRHPDCSVQAEKAAAQDDTSVVEPDDTPVVELVLDDSPEVARADTAAVALDDSLEEAPDDTPVVVLDDSLEVAPVDTAEVALDDSPEAEPDGSPELAAAGSGTPGPEEAARRERLGPAAAAPGGYPELAACARCDSSDPVPAGPAGLAHLAGLPRDGCCCSRADWARLDRLRARGARRLAARGDTLAAADFPLHSTARDRRPAGMASVEAAL